MVYGVQCAQFIALWNCFEPTYCPTNILPWQRNFFSTQETTTIPFIHSAVFIFIHVISLDVQFQFHFCAYMWLPKISAYNRIYSLFSEKPLELYENIHFTGAILNIRKLKDFFLLYSSAHLEIVSMSGVNVFFYHLHLLLPTQLTFWSNHK